MRICRWSLKWKGPTWSAAKTRAITDVNASRCQREPTVLSEWWWVRLQCWNQHSGQRLQQSAGDAANKTAVLTASTTGSLSRQLLAACVKFHLFYCTIDGLIVVNELQILLELHWELWHCTLKLLCALLGNKVQRLESHIYNRLLKSQMFTFTGCTLTLVVSHGGPKCLNQFSHFCKSSCKHGSAVLAGSYKLWRSCDGRLNMLFSGDL